MAETSDVQHYYTITFACIVCLGVRRINKQKHSCTHTERIVNGTVLIDTSHPPYVTCKLGRNSYT